MYAIEAYQFISSQNDCLMLLSVYEQKVIIYEQKSLRMQCHWQCMTLGVGGYECLIADS